MPTCKLTEAREYRHGYLDRPQRMFCVEVSVDREDVSVAELAAMLQPRRTGGTGGYYAGGPEPRLGLTFDYDGSFHHDALSDVIYAHGETMEGAMESALSIAVCILPGHSMGKYADAVLRLDPQYNPREFVSGGKCRYEWGESHSFWQLIRSAVREVLSSK